MGTSRSRPDGRASRSAATRTRILEAAQGEFAHRGFADASLADIGRKASMTTGAIYHHFGDKKGLFQAVAEKLEQEILDQVMALPPRDDPWETFLQTIGRGLEICAQPEINRIVFKDAPSVIGLAEWRQIEVQYAFGMMRDIIGALASADIMEAPDPAITSQIILGAIIEAAQVVASAEDADAALEEAKTTVLTMVASLKKKPPTRSRTRGRTTKH